MISAEGLEAGYFGKPAISGVTMRVGPGESVAVLGANGAGKSTLFKAFAGLAEISSGRAEVCGLRVERKNYGAIRRLAGFVFQNPDDQLFCANVAEDVMFGLLSAGAGRNEARSRAEECMAMLGISHLASRAPYALSDGEKKRAALCGVLAMSPSVVFFDEPTAQLDPRGRREFSEIVGRLECTKIIATHDLGLARALCSKAAVLRCGSLAAFGDSARILDDAALMYDCGLA